MFFTCQISRVMGSEFRGLFEKISELPGAKEALFKHLPTTIEVKLSELVSPPIFFDYFLSIDFVVYPKFVLFWTFQTLFLGVVLQMLIKREKIVKSEHFNRRKNGFSGSRDRSRG